MPCPHHDIKIVQRSNRQSAVAAAAYQSGERLFSEYDQKQKYYAEKRGIVHTEIMLPPHAPPEYADRNTLWNAAETQEKQWNSQLARRIVLAIPREIPPEQHADLIRDYCREFFISKGMIADFAIHDKEDGNPHAHILLTMRAMDETGKWLPKSRKVYDLDENGERIRLPSGNWKSHKEDIVDWNDQKYGEIWRQGWAAAANRYITDRFLPDKAIDLVDEACAMIRTEIDSMPTEMDDINRHIMQLEIEEAALKKDDDELTKARLAEVQKELAEQRDEFNQMKAKWESEKNAITKVNKLREEIERVNAEMERAERQYDLNKAAELKYGELPKLKKELAAEEAIAEKSKGEDSLLRDKVTEEEIARIVGRWTGIPVAKLMEGEREKLLHLEDTLHQRVIGQDEAVKRVSEAILRSRAGIQDPNRPLGSFLFLGPTGVGKTELAKALAQALFDDEKNMVRIDMSEYMEKFSVSRLIGAPPGYVGYDEGGQLTEAVRRHPYSVVLFDEVEKAHPDVFNVLLQVLDDGRITDSQGRTVDFKNTILIMTSNLGSEYILNGIANDDITPEARAQVDALLKTHFRPEFLNRIDEIVYYKPLTKEQISKIVLLMLDSLNKRLADRQLKVELTDAAMNAVIDQGFDPVYGARPLKRFIQSKIETLVAKHIIAADVKPGDTLTIDVNENGELYMRW